MSQDSHDTLSSARHGAGIGSGVSPRDAGPEEARRGDGEAPCLARQVVFGSRPEGSPTLDNFVIQTVRLPPLGDGEVRVRNAWMSIDSGTMRVRMRTRPSPIVPLQLGTVFDGAAVGVVEASLDPRFEVGDFVLSNFGWRDAFNAAAEDLELLDTVAYPAPAYLGVAGLPGFAAYLGVTQVLDLRAGQTVFVSAASGAVGSMACQIARIRGATVVGSACGPVRCQFLRNLGVDRVIDRAATDDLAGLLREAAPQGIDACLDAAGGLQLSAALEVAVPRARIALVGTVALSNALHPNPEGQREDLLNIMLKELQVQGVRARMHPECRPQFLTQMKSWIEQGRIVWRQSVFNGLDSAPAAFLRAFEGGGYGGKVLVCLQAGLGSFEGEQMEPLATRPR